VKEKVKGGGTTRSSSRLQPEEERTGQAKWQAEGSIEKKLEFGLMNTRLCLLGDFKDQDRGEGWKR